ncbi:MAG TPA: hypothetical protein VIL36_08445 [Acidimicrobiales bacterium]
MAEKRAATKKAAAKKASGRGSSSGFSAEERAAMRERAREAKAAANREAGERDLLAKIAEMPEPDRTMAERVHAVVSATAPELAPRTWYGMPAYAKDGAVLCFFQPASKFKARYATFGFNDNARLDDGTMWPTAYALTEVDEATEQAIARLVAQAVADEG